MLADLEYTFSQHEETARRAEANAALIAATRPMHRARPQARPRRRLWDWLRRLTGTPATA